MRLQPEGKGLLQTNMELSKEKNNNTHTERSPKSNNTAYLSNTHQ